MATPTKYVQTNTLYLAGSGVIVGATSIVLTTFTDIYGNVLTMTDFGSKGYGTLEPDTTNEEGFTFTGVTANANGTYTLTGVATVLAKSPYTETSGLVRSHFGGTKVVITDNVAFWNTFANKANDEVITGTWTFNVAPSSLSATPASTSVLGNVKLSAAASKSLSTATVTIASPGVVTNNAHGLIAGDSIQFTTTGALPTGLTAGTTYYVIAAGLTANAFELALTVGGTAINTTGSQSGVHTLFRTTPFAVVDNDPRVFPNAYAADAGSTDAYAITLPTAPAAYATGQLYAFKANTINTGAATLNVNALGAITIKKGGTTDLSDGDISAGMYIIVLYDGTNFQLMARSVVAATDVQVFTASGTWTKPTGAQQVEATVIGCGGGGSGGGTTNPGLGGGGGGYSNAKFPASVLGATVAVTTSATGGAGALGTTGAGPVSATNGTDTTFGTFLKAGGGVAGTASAGTGGGGTIAGGTGGASGAVGAATVLAGAGGGGGGPANTAGGAGGAVTAIPRAGGIAGASGAGGPTGGTGGAANSAGANESTGGSGGGGGGGTSANNGVGGTGATGGNYGGGGGGGGVGSGAGSPSGGPGGPGGPGIAVIITYR